MSGVIRGNFEIVPRTLKFITFLLYFLYFFKSVYFMSKSDKFQGFSFNLKNRSNDAICIPLSYSK